MMDFLQRYVFAHFGYKVVSLALAVGLWWALAHDPPAEVEVAVPIEFVGDSSNEMYWFAESQLKVAVVFAAAVEPLLQTRIPTGN